MNFKKYRELVKRTNELKRFMKVNLDWYEEESDPMYLDRYEELKQQYIKLEQEKAILRGERNFIVQLDDNLIYY